MSQFNFENYFDGESDDREDLIWSELDWAKYINECHREVRTFLNFYKGSIHNPNRLDDISRSMGWSPVDWLLEDDSSVSIEIEHRSEDSFSNDPYYTAQFDPYTVHKSPLYIAILGISWFVQEEWQKFLISHSNKISAINAWNLSQTVLGGEKNAVLAINAMDLGYHLLSVCHLKRCLYGINESLRELRNIDLPAEELGPIKTGLFDLREIYLRVLNDCRAEPGWFEESDGDDDDE